MYKENISNVFTYQLNFIFCKYKQILILMVARHSGKVGTKASLPLGHMIFPFNHTL